MLFNCGVEKTLESPLDCKEIQPVHPKGDQSWVFIRRTDAEAETPVLWPPHAKSWLIGKDPDAGRDWGQVEKGTTGWDGWMASLTWWAWAWVNSKRESWWWTGRPGVLRFMGSQRVGHNWETELTDWRRDKLKKSNISQRNALDFQVTTSFLSISLIIIELFCVVSDCNNATEEDKEREKKQHRQ